MSVKLCQHRKEDGIPCYSPALHGQGYCYFHLRYIRIPAAHLAQPAPHWRLALQAADGKQPQCDRSQPEASGDGSFHRLRGSGTRAPYPLGVADDCRRSASCPKSAAVLMRKFRAPR
jgi:hypothetical protein